VFVYVGNCSDVHIGKYFAFGKKMQVFPMSLKKLHSVPLNKCSLGGHSKKMLGCFNPILVQICSNQIVGLKMQFIN